MRLDFKLDPGAGEMPSDFASRFATRAYRDVMREFCIDFDLDFRGIVDGRTDAVSALALLAGCDAGTLMAEAFVDEGGRRYLYKGQTLTRKTLSRDRVRICPACLVEDMEHLTLRLPARPHRRSQWVITAIRTCDRHGMGLVDIGSNTDLRFGHDTSRTIALALPDLERMTSQARRVTPSPFESYLRSRLGGNADTSFLGSLPLHVVLRLTLVVGAVERHGPKVTLESLDGAECWRCEAEGFAVLVDGEAGLHRLMDRLQGAFLYRRADWGPKAMFGRLYEWLAHEDESPDYDPIRTLMKEYVNATLPVGRADRMFGQPFPGRRLHSIRSASKQAGLHPKRLRKLLKETGLIDATSDALSDDRVVMDAGVADAFLARIGQAMTLKEVAARLGIPRPLEVELTKAGLLKPTIQGGNAILKDHAFTPDDVEAFIGSLRAKVDFDIVQDDGFVDIPTAAHRSCCSSTRIVQLLVDGTLDRVAHRAGAPDFLSVLVDVAEVRRHVTGPDHGGITLREVERSIGIGNVVVKILLKEGLLASVTVINPVMKRPQTVVLPDELERFQREFVFIGALARERGLYLKIVNAELAAAGVRPVLDPKMLKTSLYRRADVG